MKWVQRLPFYLRHKRSNSLWTAERGEECQEVEGPPGDFQQMLRVSDSISIRREINYSLSRRVLTQRRDSLQKKETDGTKKAGDCLISATLRENPEYCRRSRVRSNYTNSLKTLKEGIIYFSSLSFSGYRGCLNMWNILQCLDHLVNSSPCMYLWMINMTSPQVTESHIYIMHTWPVVWQNPKQSKLERKLLHECMIFYHFKWFLYTRIRRNHLTKLVCTFKDDHIWKLP